MYSPMVSCEVEPRLSSTSQVLRQQFNRQVICFGAPPSGGTPMQQNCDDVTAQYIPQFVRFVN